MEKRKGLWTEPWGTYARHKNPSLHVRVPLYERSTTGKSTETESEIVFSRIWEVGRGGEWPLHGDVGFPSEGDENVLELDSDDGPIVL